jgi:hypothetical protein
LDCLSTFYREKGPEGGDEMKEEHGKNSREVRLLKGLHKLMILIMTFVCVGCSGGLQTSLNNTGDPGANDVPKMGNSVNYPPILYSGSKFIYQDITLSDGKSSRVTMEVKERKQFEHKQAYWIDVTGKGMNYFNLYDMNLNWIGLFGIIQITHTGFRFTRRELM